MKPIIPFALLGALFAVGANAATTDPVGYITHTINPNGGAASALTIVGPSLVQPNDFVGASTDDPSGASTITFAGGVPETLDTSYVLEITSGDSEGWWSTVMSSDATSVTTNDAFPAGLAVGTEISVRKHNTVLSSFGANEPGLTEFGAGTPDEIQFLNSDQSLTSVIYATVAGGAPADGWYFTADFSSADGAVIEPGAAVLVKNFQGAELTFQSVGSVKLTDTQVDIFPGLTLVGQPAAAGATIDETGFATELIEFDSGVTNDELQFLSAAQALTSYAALGAGVAGPDATMGNLATGTPAGSDPFPEGTGAIVKRLDSQAASPITIQGSTVAP